MILDLWRCDRCGTSQEFPKEIVAPNGWAVVTVKSGDRERPRQLCEGCHAAFLVWVSPTPPAK